VILDHGSMSVIEDRNREALKGEQSKDQQIS
jgi:hypothetical protein